MTIKELIEELKKYPEDARVDYPFGTESVFNTIQNEMLNEVNHVFHFQNIVGENGENAVLLW